jgi:hypothetical protein
LHSDFGTFSLDDASGKIKSLTGEVCRGNAYFILFYFILSYFIFLVSWGGVRLSPLGTSVNIWPIVPAPDDR